MKVAGSFESQGYRILRHLSQDRMPLRDILRIEKMMFQQLDFKIDLPTPLTFLEGLGTRYWSSSPDTRLVAAASPAERQQAQRWLLANFLVELALFDVEVEYLHAPVVLAAGVLSITLLAMGDPIVEATYETAVESPPSYAMLVEDLTSYCQDIGLVHAQLRDCEEALLGLWARCERGIGPFVACYEQLCTRYSRQLGAVGGVGAVHLRDGLGNFLHSALEEFNGFHGRPVGVHLLE
eukprot:gnl/TRDRNA2_/TRDRNA2_152388_c2_seq1.p1 gnl/TRDRNA2_/TRDRNA2_152388_c2~~gnl/TRDRNA2_/TRDRNA2_152388_c2_seq1.p1  ORF type:complete len:262 (+),score=42.81 gnl/TRDRNA2_/TRDRNA2_152388_c2_seq1:77-787(+)